MSTLKEIYFAAEEQRADIRVGVERYNWLKEQAFSEASAAPSWRTPSIGAITGVRVIIDPHLEPMAWELSPRG